MRGSWTGATLAAVAAALLSIAPRAARGEPAHWGLKADLGVPDGLVGSLAYRPHRLFTTHLGIGHNSSSVGVRGGLRLAPTSFWVAPYISVEAGHYFRSETAQWMRRTASTAGLGDEVLDRLGYSFGNGHLGLRLGGSDAALFIQGGVSYIHANADTVGRTEVMPSLDLRKRSTARVWIVSGQTGLMYFF